MPGPAGGNNGMVADRGRPMPDYISDPTPGYVYVGLWFGTYWVPVALVPLAAARSVKRWVAGRTWSLALAAGVHLTTAFAYGCIWSFVLIMVLGLMHGEPVEVARWVVPGVGLASIPFAGAGSVAVLGAVESGHLWKWHSPARRAASRS